jgi:hypothetical protein
MFSPGAFVSGAQIACSSTTQQLTRLFLSICLSFGIHLNFELWHLSF